MTDQPPATEVGPGVSSADYTFGGGSAYPGTKVSYPADARPQDRSIEATTVRPFQRPENWLALYAKPRGTRADREQEALHEIARALRQAQPVGWLLRPAVDPAQFDGPFLLERYGSNLLETIRDIDRNDVERQRSELERAFATCFHSLEVLRDLGIVHNDLHYDNIRYDANGHAVVLDLSHSRVSDGPFATDQSNSAVQTLGYPALLPYTLIRTLAKAEDASDAYLTSFATDVHALAVTLYQVAASGTLPLADGSGRLLNKPAFEQLLKTQMTEHRRAHDGRGCFYDDPKTCAFSWLVSEGDVRPATADALHLDELDALSDVTRSFVATMLVDHVFTEWGQDQPLPDTVTAAARGLLVKHGLDPANRPRFGEYPPPRRADGTVHVTGRPLGFVADPTTQHGRPAQVEGRVDVTSRFTGALYETPESRQRRVEEQADRAREAEEQRAVAARAARALRQREQEEKEKEQREKERLQRETADEAERRKVFAEREEEKARRARVREERLQATRKQRAARRRQTQATDLGVVVAAVVVVGLAGYITTNVHPDQAEVAIAVGCVSAFVLLASLILMLEGVMRGRTGAALALFVALGTSLPALAWGLSWLLAFAAPSLGTDLSTLEPGFVPALVTCWVLAWLVTGVALLSGAAQEEGSR